MRNCYWVYILRCADGKFYTGITDDLERRVSEHQIGEDKECFTFKRLPVKLVYYEEFRDVNQAIDAEKQIKGWSRRKKEALIDRRYELLPKLAKKKNFNKK